MNPAVFRDHSDLTSGNPLYDGLFLGAMTKNVTSGEKNAYMAAGPKRSGTQGMQTYWPLPGGFSVLAQVRSLGQGALTAELPLPHLQRKTQ